MEDLGKQKFIVSPNYKVTLNYHFKNKIYYKKRGLKLSKGICENRSPLLTSAMY